MTISIVTQSIKRIGGNNSAFLIAEAGVNHNGDMELAKKLVDAAVECGADAVKFQTFDTDTLIRKDAPKAAYQDRNIGTQKSQYDMLKELEMNLENTKMIKEYCDRKGIIFLSTPYDFPSVELLEKVNVSIYKLASIDTVCHPLIERIALTGKPLILSTGLASEEEVKEAVEAFKKVAGNTDNLILLQCNTNYPSRPEDQNLRVMETLRKYVPVVGFSDHTQGSTISLAAVAMAAKVIERHFTLDKNMEGPDHSSSMDPNEFSEFVQAVRRVESAIGTPEKKPTGGEVENLIGMRRSICAKASIPKGTVLTKDHFGYKRPGDGLHPTNHNIAKLVGKKTKHEINFDKNITLEDVE